MIAETEGVKATPGAIEAVARRAGGSMRDAQSMFDQSAAYGGGEVNEDDVKLILGLVEKTVLFDVVDAIISADRGALLGLAASVGASGSAPGLFLEDLATTVRNIMVSKLRPEDLTSYDENERERLSGWAAKIDFDEIHRYFAIITHTLERIRYSTQPQIALEMGMLRMVEGRGLVSLDNLLQNVNSQRANAERLAPQQGIAPVPMYNAPPPAGHAPESVAPDTQPAMFDGPPVESNLEPAPQEIQQAVSGQANVDLSTAIKRSVKPMLAAILDHATIQLKGDVVVITVNDLYQREQLDDAESRSKLEEACHGALGREARVVIEYHDEKKKESEPAGDVLKDRDRGIKKQVMDMPIIQDAMEIFNGEISDFRVKRQM
jgi:DNA polymerase-3 subunit gamma/tau